MTELFDGRPCVRIKIVEESGFEIVEAWIDEQDMDCICQGITKELDDENYYSIWTFGTEEERTMFILRFGG